MVRPLWLAAALLLPAALSAQPLLPSEVTTSGTSYFIYAEPGAPTSQVLVVGEGIRNGVYVLQEGTTLTELVALSGGPAWSQETERQIVSALVRVLRQEGGQRVPVYEATAEDLLREPAAHPDLRTGDVVEVDVEYEELGEPFTWRDGIEIASRVASLVSVVILLYTRIN